MFFVLLICITFTASYAQTRYTYHSNNSGADRLNPVVYDFNTTDGNGHEVYEYYTAVTLDASSPTIAMVSVGVYLNGWDESNSRDYYDERYSTDYSTVALAIDPTLYSSITYSWYVLYTDNTSETITYVDYY